MASETKYTERILDQEIDTIELCPTNTKYMIVGTYSLIKSDQVQQDVEESDVSSSSSRIGSLQVLPVDAAMSHQHPLARLDFPCALLDIRFCPYDDTLLGAATSIGELRFFRVTSNVQSGQSNIGMFSLGVVKILEDSDDVAENEADSSRPLITQFTWLLGSGHTQTSSGSGDVAIHYLATCDTTGQTRLVQVLLPKSTPSNDPHRSQDGDMFLPSTSQNVHKHLHDLEAWTITAITIPGTASPLKQVLLSGGDDSCLIASAYTLKLSPPVSANLDRDVQLDFDFENPPYRVHLDKRTHSAGVVSILPLPIPPSFTNDPTIPVPIPILTGSYDQHLRLYHLDPITLKLSSSIDQLDLELDGGVWRINLIDTYTVTSEQVSNYILLISCMHAGSYIVRLTCKSSDDGIRTWESTIELHFKGPHESMVYACAAVVDGRQGNWTVISTSFYDKRICVWRWVDNVRLGVRES